MSLSLGQIKRYKPNLYPYERKTRFDTTPVYVKLTINNFYCHHVPISLNKRDVVKRRHLIYPAHFEVKQAMLCYQTTNELWHQFIEDHHDMAMAMQNEKQPGTDVSNCCDDAVRLFSERWRRVALRLLSVARNEPQVQIFRYRY